MLLFTVRNAVQRASSAAHHIATHTDTSYVRVRCSTSTCLYAGSPEYLSLRCAQRYSSEVWRVSGDESEPRLVAVAARVDRLKHDLFVADAANACIKWLDHRDDTLKQVYRVERGARVHNALLPDARRLDLFAIDSLLDNSGLNKAETRFRLLRLRWTIKKEKEKKKVEEKEIWNVKWAEEFYRVNSEQLDANAQNSSLCHAGGHVLCSVTLSRFLVAFKYQTENERNEEKGERVGDQQFDKEIVHFDALNSTAGSLVAIAFVDGIRLYRHESAQPKAGALNLQESYRVNRENVHKLLFAGERLLVAQRSQNEVDCIWSSNIVDARLADEKPVHHELQFSAQSWCIGPGENIFYLVNPITNDLLKLE